MNNGGFGRDRAEDMWKFGWVNANRYNPDVFGPETAARYVSKDQRAGNVGFLPRILKSRLKEQKSEW